MLVNLPPLVSLQIPFDFADSDFGRALSEADDIQTLISKALIAKEKYLILNKRSKKMSKDAK